MLAIISAESVVYVETKKIFNIMATFCYYNRVINQYFYSFYLGGYIFNIHESCTINKKFLCKKIVCTAIFTQLFMGE